MKQLKITYNSPVILTFVLICLVAFVTEESDDLCPILYTCLRTQWVGTLY